MAGTKGNRGFAVIVAYAHANTGGAHNGGGGNVGHGGNASNALSGFFTVGFNVGRVLRHSFVHVFKRGAVGNSMVNIGHNVLGNGGRFG